MTTATKGSKTTKTKQYVKEGMGQLYDDVMQSKVSSEGAIRRVSSNRKLSLEASKDAKYLLGISQGGVLLAHIVAAYGSDRARDNIINQGDKVLLAKDSTGLPVENVIYTHGTDTQRERITALRKGRTWVQSMIRRGYSLQATAPTVLLSVSNMAFFSHDINILLLLSTNVSLYFCLRVYSNSKHHKASFSRLWQKREVNGHRTEWSQESKFYASSGVWNTPT